MNTVPEASAAVAALPRHEIAPRRVAVRGKFLYTGDEKFWVRGVTYGTFRPDERGDQFPSAAIVERDFAQMARHGLNAVRTYTPPPAWLLDCAQRHGLRVMVGLAWEQHVTFLDSRRRAADIVARVREQAAACGDHPAILCYVVGNEIPAPIVRWHGKRRVERFIARLCDAVRQVAPRALVTYVNYPTTEYLELPFLDFVCFNVYLEDRDALRRYLARLHNLAGERPLVMAEIGLDSRRHSELTQARSLDWQLRAVFDGGCAGCFVFAWTDEWYRGGSDIDDWDFGLTRRDRSVKPALKAVADVYAQAPFTLSDWPRISVVICSYNGSRTIRDTLDALATLDYPNYEVIVVNDGSTDATPRIAAEYDVTLISTENRGLSAARNTGCERASGEIVAYIDDDAYPDPHWLHYLAHTYRTTDHAAVGGPNIAPPGDGPIAECVAHAPGGPLHVLLTDTEAEHVPGCNMSFRKSALVAIGGFDARYRAAGDDVDACWRILDQGWTIGFNPAAVVWHHRRNSLRMYWKQQRGYGKAEALLEEKWPEKYNALGHASWSGRIYGNGLTLGLGGLRQRVYQGVWGSAPFQPLYQPQPGTLTQLPLTPEWYLLTAMLGVLALSGTGSAAASWLALLFMLTVLIPVAQSVISATRQRFARREATLAGRITRRALTAMLHLMQPAARLTGRLTHGLTPWRNRSGATWIAPWARRMEVWSEQWREPGEWLRRLHDTIRAGDVPVAAGGPLDPWDMQIRGGLFGRARLSLAIEEHGQGRQMLKFRCVPQLARSGWTALLVTAALAAVSFADGAVLTGGALTVLASLTAWRGALESGRALGAFTTALRNKTFMSG